MNLPLTLVVAAGLTRSPAPPRTDLETLETQLDHAVSRVSRPAVGAVANLGESARGYRLPGYGAIFVIAPRALPLERSVIVLHQQQSGPQGSVEIETRLDGAEEAERLAEEAGRLERRARTAAQAQTLTRDRRQIQALERQVAAFQRRAAELRHAAAQQMDRFTQDIRIQLTVPEDEPAMASPVPSVVPQVPPRPGSPTMAAPVQARAAEAGPDAPLDLPPVPPWRFWFEGAEREDDRTPEQVVSEVRASILAVLESEGPRLQGLGADESVAVAVDFVPGSMFVAPGRPHRSLVLRVRKRDLDALAAGQLDTQQWRARVEVVEGEPVPSER